jgi:hypothetical protein
MATQSGHPVAFHKVLDSPADSHRAGDDVVARSLAWLRRSYCGLHGHDHLLQFAAERMFLQCASCGHESPGWDLNQAPPTTVFSGEPLRHALVRPHLIGTEQRVA